MIKPLSLALLLLAAIRWPLDANAAAPADLAVRTELVQALKSTGPDQQKLLNEIANTGSRTALDVLNSWSREEVYLWRGPAGAQVPVLLEDKQDAAGKSRAIRIDTGAALTDAQGKDLRFDSNALTSVDTDMRLRSALRQAMDILTLSDPDVDTRHSSVVKLGNSQKLQNIPILEARIGHETNREVLKAIRESIALLRLNSPDPAVQTAALGELGKLGAIGSADTIKRLAAASGTKPEVKDAANRALGQISNHLQFVNFIGTIFRGISLGSILLIVALGLAITFGLMGVINMAHGEMIAVGAYTTYVVQNLFGAGFSFAVTLPFSLFGKQLGFGLHLPGINATGSLYECYFLFAIPLSFLTAALAGLALERTVIRFLYRRPLESLLATWGVSLVLQQLFRMVFGANNVQVDSPRWLLGHFSVDDVLFGYNRVFVIGFATVIVLGTWLLLSRTPLGLLIRSVMQNREMAACMGVRTQRVNMMTFAFGSGLAGLAGAFLSQIGNVGPSLGQSYIVDSFMTVVVGGVGSIVGTVCAAFGIGTVDQVLQQLLDSPVVGKITVLILIILFLQRKPGGLFSVRSRNLD